MKYAVTGSTGSLGRLVVHHLIAMKIPPTSIVALARNQVKAENLVKLGVEVRIADYDKPSTLDAALKGIDRLLLVSASEVGKRLSQHENVIAAAKKAGVKLLAYTSLSHADTSISPLAPEHKGTEEIIKRSEIPFVILRNNWYTENYLNDVKTAKATGAIQAAVGTGKVSSASRIDYAEAAARVLAGEGHAGKIHELSGTPWDYNDLAKAASELLARPVVYKAVSAEERKRALLAAGLPDGAADFVVAIDLSIRNGALSAANDDLERLLGRKPQGLKEGLIAALR
jgi:NAD(P)H dehydrogenase (quinone)